MQSAVTPLYCPVAVGPVFVLLSPGTKKSELEIKNWPTHYRREMRFMYTSQAGLLSCVLHVVNCFPPGLCTCSPRLLECTS